MLFGGGFGSRPNKPEGRLFVGDGHQAIGVNGAGGGDVISNVPDAGVLRVRTKNGTVIHRCENIGAGKDHGRLRIGQPFRTGCGKRDPLALVTADVIRDNLFYIAEDGIVVAVE